MFNFNILPWENLQCGQQRKCNNDPKSQAWWVHLEDGRYCFRIDFQSVVTMELKTVRISGGNVELKNFNGHSSFLMFLNEDSDLEVFTRFCNVLLCVPVSENNQEYADSILRVLRQWIRFLQKVSNTKGMDIRKQIGLLGELYFLKRELHDKQKLSFSDVLKSWTGPDKAPNDFMTGEVSYEVKSHYDDEQSVHISNEQQLLYMEKPLYLIVYSFRNEECGKDLKDVINEIEDSIYFEDKSLLEQFEEKLFFAGFNPAEKYTGLVKCSTDDPIWFNVGSDFPHVTKRGYESAISSIKYDLNLSGLNEFIVH